MTIEVTNSGPVFTVNTQTAGTQSSPKITGLTGGGYAVAWSDSSHTLGDSSSTGITAQVFDANDNKVGSEFLVNTNTFNPQGNPAIGGLSNGGFVATWEDQSATLGDTSGVSVKGQVFDPLGNKVGTEFLVNTNTANNQIRPQVTGLSGGGFAITWTDFSGPLSGRVKAQVFDGLGNKVGTEFLVNTSTTGGQREEQISALTNGNFIVTWTDSSGTLGDSSGTSVKGQIFDSLGNKIGTEFLVNTTTSDNQDQPFVAGLSGGGFAVVWKWSPAATPARIEGQFFGNAGNKIGSEFTADTNDPNTLSPVGIAALSNGGFVVAEARGPATGSAQAFDASGNKINPPITGIQDPLPAVGALTNATFVVAALNSFGSNDIEAQHFRVAGAVVANPIPDQSSPEDAAWSFQFAANTFNGGDPLTYTARTSDDQSLPGWLSFDAATRTFSGTPPLNFNGSLDLKVTASNGPGSDSDTFVLTITPVNDAPAAQNAAASGNEDTVINGALMATDPDNDPLTYSRVSQALHGTVTINPDGTFSYTPNANYNGPDSFTFKANDGALDSNAATIGLTVNPVNDAPVAQNGSASGNVDTGISGALAATDVDNDPLTYSRVSQALHGTVTVNSDGTFTYAPTGNYTGADSFTFKANDGALDSNVATVNLTINPLVFAANPGNVDEWILAGGTWAASAGPGPHPAGYHVAAVADFTADGTSDILWQNVNTGDVDLWKMKSAAWAGSVDIGTHPVAGWQIAGAGDFNHDGMNDVFWFNPGTGASDIWELANGQWQASVQPGLHPLGYQVAGIGDFNHDGTGDVLWFNPVTRDVDEWNISNGHWAGSNSIGVYPGTGYQIAGVGDFNNDGTADVLWFNPSTGATDIWMLQNGHWSASVSPGSHPLRYQVAGIGDFNHDGHSDVLFFNPSTGDVDEWQLVNGHWTGSIDLGAHPGSGWAIAGIGDFNGGGTSDVLWHQFV